MKGSATYKKLLGKYENMVAPTYRITIDKTEITEKLKASIMDISINLTSTTKASNCIFTVMNEYEVMNTAFKAKSVADYVQVGAKVEISIGYITVEPVFTGYINSVEYMFGTGSTAPTISVECLDVKCLLMKTRRLEIAQEKKFSQALDAILKEKPTSAYLLGSVVDTLPLECEMIRFPAESDYDFIVRYANYTGCEFFVIQGKLYFRKVPTSASDIMTLELGQGLLEATATVSATKLVSQVQVAGINPTNDEAILGKHKATGKFSLKSTAKQMTENTNIVFFDELVKTEKEATDKAKVISDDLHKDFMKIKARCVGIPEIVPGRTITIKGLETNILDKRWYIYDVTHSIDTRGFRTEFYARKESL